MSEWYEVGGNGGGTPKAGPFPVRLLLKDTTVDTDIGDNPPIMGATIGQASMLRRVTGALRVAITADLVVRFRLKYPDGALHTIGTFTIPSTTAAKLALSFLTFDWPTLPDLAVLIPDVIASDGLKDKRGVAVWTLEYTGRGTGSPTAPGLSDLGEYDSGTTYALDDLVFSTGGIYKSLVDPNTGHTPETSPGDWALIVPAGVDGVDGIDGVDGAGYRATSTTSLAIGTGSKTFTTQAGLAYSVGARARATSTGSAAYMEGVVTSYSTTSLVVLMDHISGSGTHTDWDINLAGDVGPAGVSTNAYISSLIAGPDTTKTITGATHGYATAGLLVQVYDNSSPRNAIEVGWTVDAATYDVVITFAVAQSDYYVVINGAAGQQGPTGATGAPGADGADGADGAVTNTGTLTADLPVFGDGTTIVKVGTKTGNTNKLVTSTGTLTSGHLLAIDASGNAIDGGAAPSAGAPDNAHYLTTQVEAGLSAEVSLGALADNSIVAVDVAASVATPRAATAADIVATFSGSGDYLKSDGTQGTPSAGSGGLVLLESHTASSSASLDFTTRNATGQSGATFQSDYDEYEIHVVNLIPATNAIEFRINFSTNGGSSYDTSSIYDWVQSYWYSGGSGGSGAASVGYFPMAGAIANTANWGMCAKFRLYSPGSSSLYKRIDGQTSEPDSNISAALLGTQHAGIYRNSAAVDAFKVSSSSGNIASGIIRVYGVAK